MGAVEDERWADAEVWTSQRLPPRLSAVMRRAAPAVGTGAPLRLALPHSCKRLKVNCFQIEIWIPTCRRHQNPDLPAPRR